MRQSLWPCRLSCRLARPHPPRQPVASAQVAVRDLRASDHPELVDPVRKSLLQSRARRSFVAHSPLDLRRMDHAPISVVIPALNSETFIEDAIRSVQTQTLKVAEIVVIADDCSDRTAEIAVGLGAD